MKPIPITSILLGLLVFPIIHAQPEAVPPAFEQAQTGDDSLDDDPPDPFDPDRTAPKMIQIQVEYIELAHEALTKLLFLAEPKATDATALRKQLQEMVAKDEANVLETQLVVAKSGQKSTNESRREFIYPTEYEPLSYPGEKPKESATTSFPHNPATPTAFDTRNVGSTLDLEATLSGDSNMVDVRLAPELLWHTGNTVWHESKDASGSLIQMQMPNFYCISINTSITCVAGKPMMIAVVSPKDSKGELDMSRKVVVFAKCDVLTVK